MKDLVKAVLLADVLKTTMSVQECAKFLGRHKETIYRGIDSGKIITTDKERPYAIPKYQFYKEFIEQELTEQIPKGEHIHLIGKKIADGKVLTKEELEILNSY